MLVPIVVMIRKGTARDVFVEFDAVNIARDLIRRRNGPLERVSVEHNLQIRAGAAQLLPVA